MARLNVYLPDDLAARARAAKLNVSALTQQAVIDQLAASATEEWLVEVVEVQDAPGHDLVMAALDAVRAEPTTYHGREDPAGSG